MNVSCLPIEILYRIMSYDDISLCDVYQFSLSNTFFKNVFIDHETAFLKHKLKRRFPFQVGDTKELQPLSLWQSYTAYQTLKYGLIYPLLHSLESTLCEPHMYFRNPIGFFFTVYFKQYPCSIPIIDGVLEEIISADRENENMTIRWIAIQLIWFIRRFLSQDWVEFKLDPHTTSLEKFGLAISVSNSCEASLSNHLFRLYSDVLDSVARGVIDLLRIDSANRNHPVVQRDYCINRNTELTTSCWDNNEVITVAKAVSSYMFSVLKFTHDNEFIDCRTACVDLVLDTRVGNAMCLCLIHCAVCQRLGVRTHFTQDDTCVYLQLDFQGRQSPAYVVLMAEEGRVALDEGGAAKTPLTLEAMWRRMATNIHFYRKAAKQRQRSDGDQASAVLPTTAGARASWKDPRPNSAGLAQPSREFWRRYDKFRSTYNKHYPQHMTPAFGTPMVRPSRMLSPALGPRLRRLLPGLAALLAEDAAEDHRQVPESATADRSTAFGGDGVATRSVKPRRRGDGNQETVAFCVGLVMRHKLCDYRGVIVGWDVVCTASPQWQTHMGIARLERGATQPFYNVLVADGSQRYEAEENIDPVLLPPRSLSGETASASAETQCRSGVGHWFEGRYFVRFNGVFYETNGVTAAEYPDDAEALQRLLAQR